MFEGLFQPRHLIMILAIAAIIFSSRRACFLLRIVNLVFLGSSRTQQEKAAVLVPPPEKVRDRSSSSELPGTPREASLYPLPGSMVQRLVDRGVGTSRNNDIIKNSA